MTPQRILAAALARATVGMAAPLISNHDIFRRIEAVCRNESNRACVRLFLACSLAKAHHPEVDARKPYTAIVTDDESATIVGDTFSGRSYDEHFIGGFAVANKLPVNPTTAFLTPALRNMSRPLTTDLELEGRPPSLYRITLQLLDDVQAGRVTAEDALAETIRILLVVHQERAARMASLLASLQKPEGAIPPSSERIVALVSQHLQSKHASRLPVLVVAAAYHAVSDKLGESVLALNSHNAADKQTGAFGDVEICLRNEDNVVTVYEMKAKRVTVGDVDTALRKIAEAAQTKRKIDNYIFVTTDEIEPPVLAYATAAYERTYGTEVAVLDCLGFLRHFLHLFHRSRMKFLDAYQVLVLAEPDSAVGQPLKELWLTLRRAAEAE